MVSIVSYNEEYKLGVLQCLKRNYEWMAKVSDDKLYDWVKPFLTYSFLESSLNVKPEYEFGQVILDDGNVVGYLGYIYVKRYYQNKPITYMTGTTWAIDEGYRIYMFKAFKAALKGVDICVDFTARESVREMLTKVFKFKTYNDILYKFYPVICIGALNIRISDICDSNQINDEKVIVTYKDHQRYNVKCIKICVNNKNSFYVFYKTFRRKTKLFRNQCWVRILGVTDMGLFTKYIKNIIWWMQVHHFALVECDANLCGKDVRSSSLVKSTKVNRLVLNKNYEDFTPDLLYSEMAILEEKLCD